MPTPKAHNGCFIADANSFVHAYRAGGAVRAALMIGSVKSKRSRGHQSALRGQGARARHTP